MKIPTTLFYVIVISIASLFIGKRYMIVSDKSCNLDSCEYTAYLTTNSDHTLSWISNIDCYEIGDTLQYSWIQNKIIERCK